MDLQRFQDASDKVLQAELKQKGIGTLGEKTLHAILKNYFEPNEEYHEIKIGNYVADIFKENEIIEIQTRQFNTLRKKLELFLSQSNVTVVYPIAQTKWLIWIDEETGEVTKKRKSPKTGQPWDILFELYKIKSLLNNPRLRFCIVMLELEEYRSLNGWSEDKKKGSTRYDRVPTAVNGEIYINGAHDYSRFIPETLRHQFTSKDFMKASGLSLSVSQTALNVLNSVGAVKRTGRQSGSYLYQRN